QYLPWYSVKSLLQVDKCDPQLLVLCQKLLLNLPNYEYCISSPFLLPGLKPNCMSSIDTFLLSLSSSTLSKTFTTWSSSLIPRYEPHASASPFPLYTHTPSNSSASPLESSLPLQLHCIYP